MFRLLPIIFTITLVRAANIASLQLIVPEDSYTLLSSGKSSQTAISPPLPPPPSNDVSAEENTIDESDDAGGEQSAPAPASVTRTTTSLSESSSASGASTSSGGATATTSRGASSSPVVITTSRKLAPSIQHIVLPAESIPLPIHVSTRPGIRTVVAPETVTIHERTIAKVGEVVQKIPTAVSHQSQTVVHKHTRVVTPIVAPATRTITSQIVRAYHTPLIYAPHGPIVRVLHN